MNRSPNTGRVLLVLLMTSIAAVSCGREGGDNQSTSKLRDDAASDDVTMVMLDGVDPLTVDPTECNVAGLTQGLECRTKRQILSWTTRVAYVSGAASLVCGPAVLAAPMVIMSVRVVAGTSATLGFIINELPCEETFSPGQLRQIEDIVKRQLPPEALTQSLNLPASPTRQH